ncbi:MAG: DUF932 domain-containing protein [bacterium]
MPANVQSMAYYGEKPWHGLGKAVPKGLTAEEMIKAAGLDWLVKKRPARGARQTNSKGDFSRYEVVRLPRPETLEEEVILGIVGRHYRVLQNSEAFNFFDPIIKEGKSYFETAGVIGDGERIWVMARMPGAMEIVSGDECYNYLLLSNAHNGEGAVIIKFTPIRVVCQNTLMLALRNGQKAYRVRHTKGMPSRLKEISDFLAIIRKIFLEAEVLFKQLARIQITGRLLFEYLDAVFPRTEKQKKDNEQPRTWDEILKIFDTASSLQIPGVKGTLWGAYNAITQFEDYKRPSKDEKPDKRLERIWFGSGADVKLRALQKAYELSRSWLN